MKMRPHASMPHGLQDMDEDSSAEKAELLIGKLVRLLVICAAIIVAAGGALYFVYSGGISAVYHVF